jgi:MoaA/NifB/PqqE/SkfB family radical SAM enzyme
MTTEPHIGPGPRRDYRIGVVFLHPGCNMHCTFCATDNDMDTMTSSGAQRVLGCVRDRGIDSVVLGGGEPFAWPHDTLRLAAWARAQGFFVQVGTNGIAMPSSREGLDRVDRFVLPLDAADAALHNASRRFGPGHHELVIQRLRALRAAEKSVTVSTVVNARNAAHLGPLAGFLCDYFDGGGALHAWHLYKFLPEGRGGALHEAELAIGDDAYDAACDAAKGRCDGFHVYKRRDMRHSKSVDFFWQHRGRIRVGSETW